MKSATLTVKAAHPDQPCPTIESAKGPRIDKKTGRDRNKIYHNEERVVPRVAFYLKRIQAGDLVEVKASKPTLKKAEG
jgi:hypothetical protein